MNQAGARIHRASGGLVVRRTAAGLEVLMIEDQYGHLSFPKGHLEAGEIWEEAAVREIKEETGIQARILASVGRVEYPVTRDGMEIRKQVRLFLLEPVDANETPVHQVEEVASAKYLPWEEAIVRHREHGYQNWDFVFDKAEALLRWEAGGFEAAWRDLEPAAGAEQVLEIFEKSVTTVEKLVQATYRELQQTAKDLFASYELPADIFQPVPTVPQVPEIRRAVEHTLLKPEATAVDILKLCHEARENDFGLVCVNPQYVALAKEALSGSTTDVCTVIGFPLGASTRAALQAELRSVVAAGAVDVDMVIPIGSMREDDVWTVYDHVNAVVTAASELDSRPSIKVILEISALSFDQVIKASLISLAAGADFIKTSTGFHRHGSRIADVHVMKRIAGEARRVKAAGGVRSREDAEIMLRFGASRLGTSSGTALVRE